MLTMKEECQALKQFCVSEKVNNLMNLSTPPPPQAFYYVCGTFS